METEDLFGYIESTDPDYAVGASLDGLDVDTIAAIQRRDRHATATARRQSMERRLKALSAEIDYLRCVVQTDPSYESTLKNLESQAWGIRRKLQKWQVDMFNNQQALFS